MADDFSIHADTGELDEVEVVGTPEVDFAGEASSDAVPARTEVVSG